VAMTNSRLLSKCTKLLLLTLCTCTTLLHGQTTTATIFGAVHDQSHAVVPGVGLTVTNTETGITRTLQSDENGRYRVSNLPAGSYQVAATFPGFASVTRQGINLVVGQEAVVDIGLSIGEVSEHIVVTDQAPMLETTSAVLSGLVTQEAIRDLPLNGRSFIELATLRAGVLNTQYGGRNESQGFGQKISISGSRFTSNLFLLDGTSMNDSFNVAGSVAGGLVAGVETVREFKVITNGYSAEYGNHTGGVLNAITRSGTNSLHGSIYAFHRNDNLDAPRWEDNFFNVRKNEFKRNQLGASAGGPVLKDRTFFFANYEVLRERLGSTQLLIVPSSDARLGILGNQVVSVHSAVQPFLIAGRVWPLPNRRDFGDGRAELVRASSSPTNQDYISGRIDHHLSPADSFFVRYTIEDAHRKQPNNVNIEDELKSRNQYVTFQYDRILTSTLLNSMNLGFTRTKLDKKGVTVEGIERISFTDSPIGHGVIAIGGLDGVGSGATDPRTFILNNYQAKNDVTWSHGSHSLKMGGNVSRLQENALTASNAAGNFSFESIRDFLINNPMQALLNTVKSGFARYRRQTLAGFYVQDDYRIRQDFTLNLGVRWEYWSRPSEIQGLNPISLDEKFYDPSISLSSIRMGDSLFVSNPSLDNFAPRVGFAWDLFGVGKTSLRGGTGIFYEPVLFSTYRLANQSAAPLILEGRILSGPGVNIDFPNTFYTQQAILSAPRMESIQKNPNQPYVAKYSLEVQQQLRGSMIVRVGYSGSRGVHLVRANDNNGRRHQVFEDGRFFFPNGGPVYNPNFGRGRQRTFDGTSDYHALRLEFEKRFMHGLQFQGAYAFSKNIDEGASVVGGTDFENDGSARNPFIKDRGLSPLDVRQAFTFTFVYDLPGSKIVGPVGYVFGGWRLNALTRLSNGSAFSVLAGFDRARQVQGTQYPDLAPGSSGNPTSGTSVGCELATGRVAAGAKLGSPDLYYDPCAFALQTAGFLGNLGRNTLIGPGVANLDFSIAKTFSLSMLSEGSRLEFRSELFNVANHANFALPSTALFTSGATAPRIDAGTIRRTNTTGRQIQLGLKLTF
jgi:hypothetical protein